MGQEFDRAAWLAGPGKKCARYSPFPDKAFRLILLGAPGVGKGTQAEMLCELLHCCQLSTGDVFRAARSGQCQQLSPAMSEAMGYMERGELVPDETVISLVKERVGCLECRYGFMLDGFPRTVKQAVELEKLLQETGQALDGVINYVLPQEEIIARLSGRRTCRSCKTTFHLTSKPPQKAGICDKCNGELYQRPDDTAEAIAVRLQAYEEQTRPLTEYFEKQDLLVSINAGGSPEAVFDETVTALLRHFTNRAGESGNGNGYRREYYLEELDA